MSRQNRGCAIMTTIMNNPGASSIRAVSLVFVSLVLTWSLTSILCPPKGSVTNQILNLSQRFWPHALNFGLALLISPLLLVMLYFLIKDLDEPVKRSAVWPATLFYMLYFALTTLSYGSQVLFKLIFMKPHTSLNTLLNWYFYQTPSMVYAINQTGYLAYALGTLLIFIPLCSVKSTLLKSINLLLVISALLQIAATLAMYRQVHLVVNLSLISGLMLLPVGILVYLYSRTQSKQYQGDAS